MKIVSRAPTRIGLVGGGTDVDPFASRFGGKVLSLAINLLHTTIVEPDGREGIRIRAMGRKRSVEVEKTIPYKKDPQFDLVFAILNQFRSKIPEGFSLTSVFDGVHSAGLGGSGSAAVSMIGAMAHWLGVRMSRMEIARHAWELETKELGWIGGKQDQLAAAFGGINLLSFGPGKTVGVEPLMLSASAIRELREWTMLVSFPGKRHSAVLQRKLVKGMSQKDRREALVALRDSVDVAVKVLKSNDFERLGILLDEAWEQKKKSNPAVTNSRIDKIYALAKASGALGGKLMGAGGTGHMFFLVPPALRERLQEAFISRGVEIVPFNFDFAGLTVEKFEGRLRKAHKVDVRRGFSPKKGLPAVFLDRDGVVSAEKHLVHRLQDFDLLPGAAEAIKRLNSNSIPIIIYHNASVVARGLCGEEQVVKLHRKMKKLLSERGAAADMILFCPHHPEAFNPEYQYNCDWRKPKNGMIKEAQRRFQFDLKRSFVVGDTARDIIMGKKAGARTVLVQTGHAGKDVVFRARPGKTVKDITEVVEFILENRQ